MMETTTIPEDYELPLRPKVHLHSSGECTPAYEPAVNASAEDEVRYPSRPYDRTPIDDSADKTWHYATECPFGR